MLIANCIPPLRSDVMVQQAGLICSHVTVQFCTCLSRVVPW